MPFYQFLIDFTRFKTEIGSGKSQTTNGSLQNLLERLFPVYFETTSSVRYFQGFSPACRLSGANQAQQEANLLTGFCAERN
jgi:hypothetical protein